jgi:acetyl-CoA carboxylase carboxyl transferase subunit alpha
MEKPVYTLEFEKPLRDLSVQLEQLSQQSLENNLDVAKEIAAIERKIASTQRDIYSVAKGADRPPPQAPLRARLR